MNKTISSLSVLGGTAGALNKWVIRLDSNEVSLHYVREIQALCSYSYSNPAFPSKPGIPHMVEYLLWQQEACAVASGMMQKIVEFHFPVRLCIPKTASSLLLFPWYSTIHTSLCICVSGKGPWKKMGLALQKHGPDFFWSLWNWSWTSIWQGSTQIPTKSGWVKVFRGALPFLL